MSTVDIDRLILCVLAGIPGLTLALISLRAISSARSYYTRCFQTQAVIHDYMLPRNGSRIKPRVSFIHEGKERIEFMRARKLNPKEFPKGTQVRISYVPGKVFCEVRLENGQPYTDEKSCYVMLGFGILLLIIAGCCVIL